MKILLVAGVIIMVLSCAPAKEPFDENEWRSQILNQDPALLRAVHFRDGKYFNPWLPMKIRPFGSYLMMRFFGEKTGYTEEEQKHLPAALPDAARRLHDTRGDFILWIGHATFLIRLGNEYWLTDPMFSKRALLPARKTPPAITPRDLAELRPLNIVISHNHYDHLDEDSIEAMPSGARFYVPLGIGRFVRDHGGTDVIEMDWWDEIVTDRGTRLTCLPAQHWSRRVLQGVNSALWSSFMIAAPGRSIYFAGDSGYFIGYREIGRTFPNIDYALMPVTAYQPRWFMHYGHMDARESLDAFRDLKARFFIPTQWGAFPLGEEPPGYGVLDLRREIKARQLDPSQFLIPDIGEIVKIR